MKKIGISLLLVMSLFGCGNQDEGDSVDEQADSQEGQTEEAFPYTTFFLTVMQGTSPAQHEEYNPHHSYEIHIPERALIVRESSGDVIGVNGQPIEPPVLELNEFDVDEQGTISFGYDYIDLYAEDAVEEYVTETFTKLSTYIYEDENGIQYQITEEEAEY